MRAVIIVRVLVVLLVLGGMGAVLRAQRPTGPPPGRPTPPSPQRPTSTAPKPTPPRGTVPPRGASPQDRADAKGRWARLRRLAEDEEDEVGDDPVDAGAAKKKKEPVDAKEAARRREYLRSFLADLKRDRARLRDQRVLYDVRALLHDGTHHHVQVDCRTLYTSAEVTRYRLGIMRVLVPKPVVAQDIVIHETAGKRRAWLIQEDGTRAAFKGDPFLLDLGGGLRLRDILPADLSRLRLSYEGEEKLEGEIVDAFSSKPVPRGPEEHSLLVTRKDRLLARMKTWRGDVLERVAVDSSLRHRAGIPAFERRRLLFRDSGLQAVVKMLKRKPNPGLDAAVFE